MLPEPPAPSLAHIDLLRIALEATDARRAHAAARDLANRPDLDPATLFGPLTQALRHHDDLVQRRAAQALAVLGARAAAVVPVLVEASRSPRWTVREAALQTLGILAPTTPAARAVLVQAALHDRDPLARRAAASALAHGALAADDPNDSSFDDLAAALQHPYPRVRGRALRALVLFPSRRAAFLPLAEPFLGDSHAKLRRIAAEVLGDCGPLALAAVPALLRRLRDRDPAVHAAAAAALARLRPLLSPEAACLLDLLSCPGRPEYNLRAALAGAGLPDAKLAPEPPAADRVSLVLQAAEDGAAARAPAGPRLDAIRAAARERAIFQWQAHLWHNVLAAASPPNDASAP